MGNLQPSAVWARAVNSWIRRPIKNYNFQNRAQRRLKRAENEPAELRRAPLHRETQKFLSALPTAESESFKRLESTKDEELSERLKAVFVESVGDNPELRRKPKPLSRKVLDEFAYLKPGGPIPEGKLSLDQATELLQRNRLRAHSHEQLASEYNVDIHDVQLATKYFMPMEIYITKAFEDFMKRKNIALPENAPVQNLQFLQEITNEQKKLDEAPDTSSKTFSKSEDSLEPRQSVSDHPSKQRHTRPIS